MPQPRAGARPHGAAAAPARVLLGYAIIYVVWGSTFLAIRYAVETLPPFLMSGARFVVAGAVLTAWARWRGAPRPTRSHWLAATGVGALLILGGTATVGWAEQWVPSGIASLLAATAPFWIVVLEWMAPGGRRPGAGVIAGLAIGLAGVAVLMGPDLAATVGSAHLWWGAAAIVGGSVLWAAGSLWSRHADLPASAPLGMGLEMLSGGVLCLVTGLLIGEWGALDPDSVSTASMLGLAYLIVFGALIGFSAYLWLMRVSRPSRVATHAYVNPVVAVLLGWAVADEPITMRTLVAAAIIIGSVALITTERGR